MATGAVPERVDPERLTSIRRRQLCVSTGRHRDGGYRLTAYRTGMWDTGEVLYELAFYTRSGAMLGHRVVVAWLLLPRPWRRPARSGSRPGRRERRS